MKASLFHRALRRVFLAIVFSILVFPHATALAQSEPSQPPVNAFFLKGLPSEYGKLEKLFDSMRDSGADTCIIEPPMQGGRVDTDRLTNLVFLSHLIGLKVFIILPTRGLSAALEEHPDWEDMRYDLGSGTLQPTGRLDLFQPSVTQYLSSWIREVAAYSVDGILLGDDFSYGDTEGMSQAALESYKKKFNAALVPGKAFLRVKSSNGNGPEVEEYGESFWNWAELKKNALLEFVQNIMKTSQAVNPTVKFGIPLHSPAMVTPLDTLARYSYDMNAFKKLNLDFYWVAIPHRDLRAKQDLNYKKSMELLARIVQAAASMVKDPPKTIIAVQTTSLSDKVLPFSEIEEATAQVLKAGDVGIAYMVYPDTIATLPSALTKKVFKRQEGTPSERSPELKEK